jgi:hypothetical protein
MLKTKAWKFHKPFLMSSFFSSMINHEVLIPALSSLSSIFNLFHSLVHHPNLSSILSHYKTLAGSSLHL